MTLFIFFTLGVMITAFYWMHLNSGDVRKADALVILFYLITVIIIGGYLLKAST